MPLLLCNGSRKHTVSMDTLHNPGLSALNDMANKNMDGRSYFVMNIPRSSKGFGFTITGSVPVRVGKVQPTSPASKAGLLRDDCIIKINGQNVSRSTADSVAKLIRSCHTVLELVVYRDVPVACSTPLMQVRNTANHTKTAAINHKQISRYSDDKENIPHKIISQTFAEEGVQVNSCRLRSSCQQSGAPVVDRNQHHQCQRMSQVLPSLTMMYSELSLEEQRRQASIASLRENLEKLNSQLIFGLHHYCLPLKDCTISPADHKTLFQNMEQITGFVQFLLQSMMEQAISYKDFPSHYFIHGIGSIYHSILSDVCHAIEDYCSGAKSAIRLLVELRKDPQFAECLKRRHFQDGEISIGTFLQKPIEWMKDSVVHLQDVFSHTDPDHQDYGLLRTVIEGLRTTCSVMTQSHTMRCQSTFSVMNAPSMLSINTQPIRHQNRLSSGSLETILSSCSGRSQHCEGHSGLLHHSCHTRSSSSHSSFSSAHNNYDNFKTSPRSRDSGISDSCFSHNNNHFNQLKLSKQFSQSDCGYVSPADQSEEPVCDPHHGYSEDMQQCSSEISDGSSSSGRSGTTIPLEHLPQSLQANREVEVAAIDSEVLDIQNRLLFAGNVKSFKIASATRHMIYAGELFYLMSGQWYKVYMVLLSDLLLITHVGKDNYITVLEEPIVLQDITEVEWQGVHATEFQLSLECSECNGEGTHGCRTTLTFRTQTMESKHTWQNIVEQRIVACRSQNDRDRQLGRVVGHFI